MTSMMNDQGDELFDPFGGGMPPGVGEISGPIMDDSSVPMSQSLVAQGGELAPAQEAPVEQYEGGGIFDQQVTGPPEDHMEQPQAPQQGGAVNYQDPYQQPYQLEDQMAPYDPQYAPAGMMDPGHAAMYPMAQAVGDLPMEHAHMLGLSVVGVAIGTLIGQRYGGTYGAVAGAVGAGALINAYRAFHYNRTGTPEAKKEARVSGTYAVGAAILGAAIWYKWADRGGSSTPNIDDEACDNPGSCDLRRAGP
jgi:hypothetical protein